MFRADPFDLRRFVEAQPPFIEHTRAELAAGRKQSHWMWFVFPQIAGLGCSAMAARFAISSLDEARAYAAHPILGPRLLDCTTLALAIENRSAQEIFGTPDDLKFRSSMTLFARACPDQPCFREALDAFFAGEEDSLTLCRLR